MHAVVPWRYDTRQTDRQSNVQEIVSKYKRIHPPANGATDQVETWPLLSSASTEAFFEVP
jgi:hypothetical protein